MILTLWWKSGSWKWTICAILAKKLWYEIISVWDVKRKIAKSLWLSISEFDALWDLPENKEEFDLKYETYQQDLSVDAAIILDSRLGFFNQPDWYNVFVDVDDNEAWRRIFGAQRETDKYDSVEEVISITKERNNMLETRYKNLYKVDLYDISNYDLIVDTTDITAEQAAEIIHTAFIAHMNHEK